MDSSNNQQKIPEKTLPFQNVVATITNLIGLLDKIPKLIASESDETTVVPTTTTTTTTDDDNNNNSSQEQSIWTRFRALLNKDNSETRNQPASKSEGDGSSKRGQEDSSTGSEKLQNNLKKGKEGISDVSQLQEKLQNNLKQIQDSLTLLQKFEESELAKQLKTQLRALEDLLKREEEKPTRSTNVPSFSDINNINKELMKLKYQIPSIRKQPVTSSRAHSQTSSGSNEGSSVQVLHMLRESSSLYNEIKDIFNDLGCEEKFILSCFAVLTEHAVVKRRLLTYWGLGEGHFLNYSKSPDEIVDGILLDLKEMGLIEPAINKRKQEVRSYKMVPLVRSALMNIFQETKLFTFDSNGNVMENCPAGKKAFLVKGKEKEKLSDKALEKSQVPEQPGEQQSWLDPEKLVTLFNVNEHSPDTQLNNLAKKKSKDVKVVDWLWKMKSLQVLYLGRWQKSAGYHIEVQDTAFLKGLKSMEKLKFLSLQGISRINKLPPFISMLKNLVVLDLKDCYNLEVLSEDISSLTNLRYLDISNCYLLGNMPKKLSSLSELQVLKGFIIGNPRREKLGNLEDLKGLKKLKKLTIIATRKDFPTPEDLGALQKLEALRKLTIAWGVQPKNSEEQAKAGELSEQKTSLLGKAAESSVRPSDELPNKLEKLDLQCFPYSTPTWLTPDDLPHLEKLYKRGGNFTTLKKGTWNVKALRLQYLSGMKTNWRELKESFPGLDYRELNARGSRSALATRMECGKSRKHKMQLRPVPVVGIDYCSLISREVTLSNNIIIVCSIFHRSSIFHNIFTN